MSLPSDVEVPMMPAEMYAVVHICCPVQCLITCVHNYPHSGMAADELLLGRAA